MNRDNYIRVELNEDIDEIPQQPTMRSCPKCGRFGILYSSGAKEWADDMGYKRWRVRLRYKCKNHECKANFGYRLGGFVARNGEFQKEPPEDAIYDAVDEYMAKVGAMLKLKKEQKKAKKR